MTYYYCRSAGCRKRPGVKVPRPIASDAGQSLEDERATILARIKAMEEAIERAAAERRREARGGGVRADA